MDIYIVGIGIKVSLKLVSRSEAEKRYNVKFFDVR